MKRFTCDQCGKTENAQKNGHDKPHAWLTVDAYGMSVEHQAGDACSKGCAAILLRKFADRLDPK